jgi:zinc transport system substrate-binding protein
MVQQIAGNTVQVVTIAEEDSDPHIFEPKPKMTEKYKDAHLWIGVGEPFEKKLLEKFETVNPKIDFVDLSTKVPLLNFNQEVPQQHSCEKCKHHKDRHIWLSPILIIQEAQIIASHLSRLVPEHKDLYAHNLYALDQEMRQLHAHFQQQLAPYHGTAILVSHPAFGYFCHQYGIVQLAAAADEEEQVRPQDLTRLCQLMKKYDVRGIVIEPHHNIKAIRSLCNQPDLPYKKINSIAPNYIDSMQQLADLIVGENK